jgi:hypothetical protein
LLSRALKAATRLPSDIVIESSERSMDTKHIVFAAVALSAACFGGPAVEINQDPEIPASRWQGAIMSPASLAGAVQIDGTAWMASGEGANRTRVYIEIGNAAPGGTHPWQVQRGRCGSAGTLFGSPADFEPIEVNGDGEGRATAEVELALPREGEYSVEVLAAPTNRELIVACGNLAPPVN